MPFPPPLGVPNLNHGQDTRANRTRHTTSSSTQSHAKQQHLGWSLPTVFPGWHRRLAAVACLARYAYPFAGVTFTPAQLMSLGLEGRLSLIGTNNITY